MADEKVERQQIHRAVGIVSTLGLVTSSGLSLSIDKFEKGFDPQQVRRAVGVLYSAGLLHLDDIYVTLKAEKFSEVEIENLVSYIDKTPALKFEDIEAREGMLAAQIQLTIEMESADYDEVYEERLRRAIADYLNIQPDEVQIVLVEEGSFKITIQIEGEDDKAARRVDKLLASFKQRDPQLIEYMSSLRIVNARRVGIDFVLVTALEEERDAVLDKLPRYQKLPPFKDDIHTYFKTELPVTFPDGETGTYQVILMPLLGMGRLQAAAATANAIARWHPRYIVLVGIAGGVAAQGVGIGDILIADQIADYELQKLTPQGSQVRWEVNRADPRLLYACRNFMGDSWQGLVKVKRPTRSKPKRHTGPIASGDKVIAFGDALKQYCRDWPKLIGVEMEAAGVATTAFQSSDYPGFFMVRCASDLADEDKDSAGVDKWRAYACDAAASFTIALLKSGPVPLRRRTR